MDGSMKVSESDFNFEKKFVKSLAKALLQDSVDVRAALITYGNYPVNVMKLGRYANLRDFELRTDLARLVGGPRRVDRAIESVATLLEDARSGVPRIVVLITAGEQGLGASSLSEAVKPLKKHGANLFVVGVGGSADFKPFRKLVTDERFFILPGFDRLIGDTNRIVVALSKQSLVPEDKTFSVDVVFLADSSSSVSRSNFKAQKYITKELSKLLKADIGKSKASFVTYGSYPRVVFDLGRYRDQFDYARQIDNAPMVGGLRSMDTALDQALNAFKQSRKDVPRIVVLMTTGREQDNNGKSPLDKKAALLKAANARIYVIAFGKEPESRELSVIVERSEDLVRIYTIQDGPSQIPPIAQKIIRDSQPMSEKSLGAEVMFLLDTSTSVRPRDFQDEIKFTKSLANILKLFSGKSRVSSVITYGSYARSTIPYNTQEEFNKSVDSALYIGGNRRMDLAIEKSLQIFRQSTHPHLTKILVLITAGNPSSDSRDLKSTFRSLRKLGIKPFVLHIGGNVDKATWISFVDESIDLKDVQSFNDLSNGAKLYRNLLMDAMKPVDLSADIVFLADSSATVTRPEYKKQREFLKDLARQLNVRPGKSRASMVIYGRNARVENRFSEYKSSSEFEQIVDEALYMGGSRRFDRAVDTAFQVLSHARSGTKKIVVFIIAGKDGIITKQLQEAAKKLRDENSNLFLVAFGQMHQLPNLESIVGNPRHVLRIPSYEGASTWVIPAARIIAANSVIKEKEVKHKTDFVILGDSSSDVQKWQFAQQIDFVQNLVKQLRISPETNRAAFISYGSSPTGPTKFYQTEKDVSTAIRVAGYVGGKRRLDRAINEALKLFKQSPQENSKALLILTAGPQDSASVSLDTFTRSLSTDRINTYVITIGKGFDIRPLLPIVKKKVVVTVDGYRSLQPKIDDVKALLLSADGHVEPLDLSADIIFMIDTSADVTSKSIDLQKYFVKRLSEHFKIASDKSRAALIVYGNIGKAVVKFDNGRSLNEFMSLVDQATPVGGQRRMDKAIETASLLLTGSRPNVPKIAFLLTAGRQASGSFMKELHLAAEVLKNMRTKTYVIAIGNQVNDQELNTVSDNPKDIFRVLSFGGLPSYVNPVVNTIAKNHGNSMHDLINYDIVFASDTSASVSQQDIDRQKEFIKSFARRVFIGSVNSRGALLNYGNFANINLRFDGYQTLGEFEDTVNKVNPIGGERRLDQVLHTAVRVLSEARPNAFKIVVLLLAGVKLPITNSWQVTRASMMLKNLDVKSYVVIFGRYVDIPELKQLTGGNRGTVNIPSNVDFGDATNRAVDLITGGSGPMKSTQIIADVVFLADSSSGVGKDDFTSEKTFVKNFARKLDIIKGPSRVAMVSYGSYPRTVFGLEDFGTFYAFDGRVNNAPYVGGSRNIPNALTSAKQILDNGNPRHAKVVVMLTAGIQDSQAIKQQLQEASNSLRLSGILTYIIIIGRQVNSKYLLPIVDRPEDLLISNSFNKLPSLVDDILGRITTGVSSMARYKAQIVFMVDGSSGVSRDTFERLTKLLKSLSKYFNIHPDGSHGGIVVFGSSPRIIHRLSDDQSTRNFENAIDSLAPVGGLRNIDLALEEGANLFLDSQPNLPRIAFLLTTGRQADKLGNGRQYLTDMNSRIIVIGVGQSSGSDVEQYKKIASTPKDVFFLQSPDLSHVPMITQHTRTTQPQGQLFSALPPTDLIFLIDSSNEVTNDAYNRQKEIIKSITRLFDIGLSRTRVAVLAYSDNSRSVINFGSSSNIIELHKEIDAIPYYGGKRRLDKAAQEAGKLLGRTRPETNKLIFFLATGRHVAEAGSIPLRSASLPLHQKAQVFAIGLGSRPDFNELRQLTNHDGNVFMVPSSGYTRPQLNLINAQLDLLTASVRPLDEKIDLLFMVDSSNSVGKYDFFKSKEFVKGFSRGLTIAPDKTNVALLTFGDTPEVNFAFGDHTTTQALLRAIDDAAYVGGKKRMDKALVLAARLLQKARPNSKKIVLVISDGKQDAGPGVEPLDLAGRRLHNLGAKVYVIGTGVDKITELQKMARGPDDLFVSRSYDDLLRYITYVFTEMSKGPLTTGPKGYAADIMFLVDASDALTYSQFQQQKAFLAAISRRLVVSPFGTRAAFITYSDNAQLDVNFDSYKTTPEFFSLLSRLQKRGGSRRLDKAIELAGETFKTVSRNAAKVLVILVKGKPITSPDSKSLADLIKPLRNQGIVTNVIGIGPGLDASDLTNIVQRPENILFVDDLNDLQTDVERMWKHIVGTTIVSCDRTLDVGIVMDSSGSLGPDHYSKEKTFVKSIIRELINASPRSRVGIVPFSDYAEVAIDFNNFATMSLSAVGASIDRLSYEQGRTRIDRALDVANRGLFTSKRPGVPQVLMLITDGRQSKDPGYIPVNQSMIPIRNKGIKTLTVGIGKDIDLAELKLITGDNKNVFIVGAFSELEGIVRGLVARSCST